MPAADAAASWPSAWRCGSLGRSLPSPPASVRLGCDLSDVVAESDVNIIKDPDQRIEQKIESRVRQETEEDVEMIISDE